MKNHEIIPYDCLNPKYNFRKALNDLFSPDGLRINFHKLHEYTNENYTELFKVGDDSKTVFHSLFYSTLRKGWPEFEDAYLRLIAHVIAPLYKEEFLYQTTPTFRVHIPENVCVGDFHTDVDFGHPPKEKNYIVPLTISAGTSSIWIESAPGKKDYAPVPISPGKIIAFNGGELSHGSMINDTGNTRVSFDFRVLKLSDYNANHEGISMTQKTKFTIGSYYSVFKK